MLKTNKSISVSGQSLIEVTENGNKVTKQVAYMNASIPEEGNLSINKSIQDKQLFETNKESVLADFSEFETYVYGLAE